MSALIKNGTDLDNFLSLIATKMLKNTRDIVYQAIKDSIQIYYKEYNPKTYHRTYKFLKSLVKTEIKKSGNQLICEVKIDEDYLSSTYPYTHAFDPNSYPHQYDGRFAEGRDVVNWANLDFSNDDENGGNHGYTVGHSNRKFWDSALEDLGNIINLLKDNLQKQGIKII